MRVVVTGGAGFIGRRLALRLLEANALTDSGGRAQPVERIVLFDRAAPDPRLLHDPRIEAVIGDIANPEQVRAAIGPGTGAVFHLAAVVSAGAEEDFDLGMAVNLQGTMNVLAAARALPAPPRLVFASSVAVYGGAMPETIPDALMLNPQTSYGAQKAMGELLVQDYARKGYVEGCALRFPTVVVRPGKPNRAASTWASSIIREPLQGGEAVCPVEPGPGDVCAFAAQGRGCGAEGRRPAAGSVGAGQDAGAARPYRHRAGDAGGARGRGGRAGCGARAFRARPVRPGDRERLGGAFRPGQGKGARLRGRREFRGHRAHLH